MGKISFFVLVGSRGGGTGGAGGAIAPPSFWDLFSKFWEFFENPLFAIYYSPPIKNLLPPTLGKYVYYLLRIKKLFYLP